MVRIVIPANGWRPRPHQMPLWSALESGKLRLFECAHRRWGKDEVALHWAATAVMTRAGNYHHGLPEYAQARKAIWTAVNPHTGRRRIDEAFPHEIRQSTNDQEMFIRFKNGSTWQVIGSDNYDRLVGSSIAGIVFSEWALSNPAAWAYISPIVSENKGYALFITTPRGRNHALDMMKQAQKDEKWFSEVSTIDNTHAIPFEQIEDDRKMYHALFGPEAGDSLIQQEYWCSFESAILGAYWGKEMVTAEDEGRICEVEPHDGVPVQTAWDLGVDDATAIWWFQPVAGQIRVLDYYEGHGYAISHYAEVVKRKAKDRGWQRGTDWVPQDAKQREMTSGGRDGRAKQRLEVMIECGLSPRLIPAHNLMDGISAARQILKRCYWDKERCSQGLECLRQYQTEWDDKLKCFKKTPLHNWASHGADAWRYLSMAYRELAPAPPKEPGRMLTIGDAELPKGVKQVTLDDLWSMKRKPSRRI